MKNIIYYLYCILLFSVVYSSLISLAKIDQLDKRLDVMHSQFGDRNHDSLD